MFKKSFKKFTNIFQLLFVYTLTAAVLFNGFGAFNNQSSKTVDTVSFYRKFDSKPVNNQIKINLQSGVPEHISIPSLSIDKDLQLGLYDPVSEQWTLKDAEIYYAESSPIANNISGNTFIYGHRYPWTLGRMQNLEKGSVLHIYTKNHFLFTYVFESSKDYEPTDTSIFAKNGPPRLTVQTCGGLWNQSRVMYSFSLQKVDKV